MKKYEVVKENNQFSTIIQTGNYSKNKYIVLYYKDNSLLYPRFGISVGKKIGNAVTRNKFKRQIRSIIDNHKNLYSNGKDYIIMIRKSCNEISFQELESALIEVSMKQIRKGANNEAKI